MAKKYVTGEKPLFDVAYINWKDQSDILRRANNNVFKPSLDNRQTVTNLINGLNEQIPSLYERLKEIKQEFKDHQQSRINEGWDKPTVMPPELEARYYDMEARINVREDELARLEQIRAAWEKEVEDKRKSEVLRYGAQGSTQLRDGIVVEIDGQNVSIIDRWPVIYDDLSPFDGMRVCDYRRTVSVHWFARKRKMQNDLEQKSKSGEKVSEMEFFNMRVPVDKTWPKGVKNWKTDPDA